MDNYWENLVQKNNNHCGMEYLQVQLSSHNPLAYLLHHGDKKCHCWKVDLP